MIISYKHNTDGKWQYRATHLILLMTLLTVSAFFLCERFIALSDTDRMRLEMYKSTLNSTIEQYYILPYMLSIDEFIRKSIIDKNIQEHALNERIEYLNNHLKTAAIFILDAQGKAIASSNWQEAGSYVGQDYITAPTISRLWPD